MTPYSVERGQKKPSPGGGSFTVLENEYGRASLTYFKDEKNFSITTAGSAQGPITHMISQDQSRISAGDIFLIADVYLRASSAKGKLIHLSGVLVKLIQVETKGLPLFKYSEDELDFMLPKSGKETILLGENYYGKQIYLDISVEVEGELTYEEKKVAPHATFNTQYHLYNQDTKKYELENKGCILGMGFDTPGEEATCFNQKVYEIQGGDSLLYIAAYEIKNPTLDDDNKIRFHLEVSHTYAINPIMDESCPEELKSDKTTVILFDKQITTTPGQRIEIEIPQDKESLLPFKSRETIALISSVQDVKQR
jgi:hypothetical protein